MNTQAEIETPTRPPKGPKTRTGEIVFIGDTHGEDATVRRAAAHNNGSLLIHVGDFGIGFQPHELEVKRIDYLNELMIRNECILHIIRGNHDNPAYWNTKEIEASNIKFIHDHAVYAINGKRIYYNGGGISVDRLARTKGKDYWPRELANEPLHAEDLSVDIMVTHAGLGEKYIPELIKGKIDGWLSRDRRLASDLGREAEVMGNIEANVTAKTWVCGHYHESAEVTCPLGKRIFLGVNEIRKHTEE